MFFTLGVSAASPRLCAELADRARVADPAVMPIPGPAVVVWRSPDGRAALLRWGGPPGTGERRIRGRARIRRRARVRGRARIRRCEGDVAGRDDLGRVAHAGQRARAGRRPHLGHPCRSGLRGAGAGRGHRRRPRHLGRLDRQPPRRPRPAARGGPAQSRLPARLGDPLQRRVRPHPVHHPAPAQRRPHQAAGPGRGRGRLGPVPGDGQRGDDGRAAAGASGARGRWPRGWWRRSRTWPTSASRSSSA